LDSTSQPLSAVPLWSLTLALLQFLLYLAISVEIAGPTSGTAPISPNPTSQLSILTFHILLSRADPGVTFFWASLILDRIALRCTHSTTPSPRVGRLPVHQSPGDIPSRHFDIPRTFKSSRYLITWRWLHCAQSEHLRDRLHLRSPDQIDILCERPFRVSTTDYLRHFD
jgi:hypothetical protein